MMRAIDAEDDSDDPEPIAEDDDVDDEAEEPAGSAGEQRS